MSVISMKQLLEAGVHFGHQTRRWNPKMAEYIYTERNGIYIIDLQKSVGMVDDAYKAIADIAAAVAEVNADATVSKVTYRLTKLVEAGEAEKTDVTVPGVDGAKARKVKAFRAIEA